MTKKMISTPLDAELMDRVNVVAQELQIGRYTYIERALETKLQNSDQDRALVRERDEARKERDTAKDAAKDARRQRAIFKAKMEESVESLAVADAKLKAHQKRSWLAKLVGWKPNPHTTGGITLEALVRFHLRLKNVGMTPKQIDQILLPLYQSAGVELHAEKLNNN